MKNILIAIAIATFRLCPKLFEISNLTTTSRDVPRLKKNKKTGINVLHDWRSKAS